jgi:hypothetical protein
VNRRIREKAGDSLPDRGGGGSARVVPGHSGRDRAAEIGNHNVRMNADDIKTPQNTEEVSSHPGKKVIGAKKGIGTPLCQRKAEGGVAKRLANLWRRNRFKKNAHACRGQEIKWEIPVNMQTVGAPRMTNGFDSRCSG